MELQIGLSSLGNEYGTTGFLTHRNNPGDPFGLTFVGGQNISLSQSLDVQSTGQRATISILGQAQSNIVSAVNGSAGSIIITGGNNITVTGGSPPQTITIAGPIFTAGNNVSLSQSAGTITIGNVVSSGTTVTPVGSANVIGTQSSYFSPADHIHAGVAGFGISGGNTLGNSSGSTIGQLLLAGGNNITLSQMSGAGGATITVQAPSTSFIQFLEINPEHLSALGAPGQSSISVKYTPVPNYFALSAARVFGSIGAPGTSANAVQNNHCDTHEVSLCFS